MLEFAVLSSGSRANCLYLSDGKTRILVDCGLSTREATKRLAALGIEAKSIQAIIVTHEHSDHVAGIPRFAKNNAVPVYSNQATLNESSELFQVKSQVTIFQTGEKFQIGELKFEPFSISHDAADPVGLRISNSTCALGVVTDLGQMTTLVKEKIRDLDGLIIESNHDPDLLKEAPYPWELKQRISGRTGHLSNGQAACAVQDIVSNGSRELRYLLGAHVSEKSNHPSLVAETLTRSVEGHGWSATPEIIVASAQYHTPLFTL